MNTIATDRLFSDVRLKRLTWELGCPAKALGVLMWLWHGTQNLSLIIASERDILDVFPQGLRGPRKVVEALVRSGWLEIVDDGYRVVGNDEHVQSRDAIVENARRAAQIRWEQERARRMQDACTPHMQSASGAHAPPMPSLPPALPPEEEYKDPNERGLGGDHVARAREGGELSKLNKNHPEVQLFEGRYRELFVDAPFSPKERSRAAEIVRRCAEAKVPWNAVLTAYADERWNRFAHGSLDWLRDHLLELLNVLRDADDADDPQPIPSDPKWPEWFERQKKRGKR